MCSHARLRREASSTWEADMSRLHAIAQPARGKEMKYYIFFLKINKFFKKRETK
jgi:hypothetical protein